MRPELEERLDELARRAGLSGIPRATLVALLIAGVLVVALALWRWVPTGEPVVPVTDSVEATQPPAAAAASTEATEAVVHVVGAVRRPGVYRLPLGARGADAVEAAGGALGSADLSGLNLARVIADGEQIVVPKRGESPPGVATGGPAAPGAAPASGGKVNLNSAGESELEALPGVGPATAKRIVQDRETNGPFRAVEDLMRVPGIGPKKFEALKDLVST